MDEMPSQSTCVQRLKVAILPLGLPHSGTVAHAGDMSITGKSHKKKPDGSSKDDAEITYKLYNILQKPMYMFTVITVAY
jgi:hypothetical protein